MFALAKPNNAQSARKEYNIVEEVMVPLNHFEDVLTLKVIPQLAKGKSRN
jgi:hypothetical protein